jgi:hypothetical protein
VQEAARISAARNFLIGTTTDAGQKLQVNGTSKITASDSQLTLSHSGGVYSTTLVTNSIGNFYIQPNGSFNALTIASTGAATFSNTLTAVGTISYTGTSKAFEAINGTTGYVYQYYGNTGATFYLGVERSTGGGLFTGSSNYATTFGSNNATDLQFGTNGIIRTTISSSGNLLIGTTTDAGQKLQVNGTASFTSTGLINITSNYNFYKILEINNTNNTSGNGTIQSLLGTNCNDTNSYHFVANTGTIDKFYIYGNGTYTTVSDQRLKKNINKVTDNYLDKVLSLNIVNYNWIDQLNESPAEFGMIAQEVEKIIPNIVHEGRANIDGIKYKGIQSSVLPYILIKAIQELNTKIENLK